MWPGYSVVQNVWSAMPLARFTFGWQTPSDTASELSWKIRSFEFVRQILYWLWIGRSGRGNRAQFAVGVSQGWFGWRNFNGWRNRATFVFWAVWTRRWPLATQLVMEKAKTANSLQHLCKECQNYPLKISVRLVVWSPLDLSFAHYKTTITTENGATRGKRNIRDHDLNHAHELRTTLTLLYWNKGQANDCHVCHVK